MNKKIIAVVTFVVWQAIVLVLSAAGIFGDIYQMLGIPWDARGLVNIMGTILGLFLLELPLIIFLSYFFFKRRQT